MGRRPLSTSLWDLLQYTQRQLDNIPSQAIARHLETVEIILTTEAEKTGSIFTEPDTMGEWLAVHAFLQDQWSRYDEEQEDDDDFLDLWDVEDDEELDDDDDDDDEEEDDREDLARIGDALRFPDVIGVEDEPVNIDLETRSTADAHFTEKAAEIERSEEAVRKDLAEDEPRRIGEGGTDRDFGEQE